MASAGSVVTVPGLPGRRLPGTLQLAVRRLWLLGLQAAAHTAGRFRGAPRLADIAGRLLVFAPDDPAWAVRAARVDFLATDPTVLAHTTLASVSDDGSRLAPALRRPALIVRGDRDKEVSAADAHRLLSRLPDGRMTTLPSGGHMLPLTDSDAVAHHIADWARRTLHRAGSAEPT